MYKEEDVPKEGEKGRSEIAEVHIPAVEPPSRFEVPGPIGKGSATTK